VAFGYLNEIFTAWYSDEEFDAHSTLNRMLGYYAWVYWHDGLQCWRPPALWFQEPPPQPGVPLCHFAADQSGNVGGAFVIIVTSLHRDFLPSSWGIFRPTIWDWATLTGSLGLFFTLIFLFIRLLPMISISEVRRAATEKRP
jgi:molybdopterin-containing oxidoreductase family membrane subunit